ncbi:hypothetical protein BH23GEM5_BH23GEM5_11540 [soil metagenome]
MKLWIDADAAPRDVKEIVCRAAKRLELETVLVALWAQGQAELCQRAGSGAHASDAHPVAACQGFHPASLAPSAARAS